jgi:hypothetical protein
MQKFRLFVQDVGKHGFSGYGTADIYASTPQRAVNIGVNRWGRPPRDLIALPHSRLDLWPDGQTGQVTREALEFKG